MKKIKKVLKNNYVFLLSFFIPFFIYFIFLMIRGVIPFGDNTLLRSDLFHQYAPMLDNFFNNVISEGNYIYSFNYGLGQPIIKMFFNYCSSPFNFILLFFNKFNILSGISILIGFKCSVAALMMSYYIAKKFNKKNLLVVALSLLYAFSGYFQAYYFNIMWLDGMIFLPLIILGIENICNGKSSKLYIGSLFLMIWSNYYIAYMICLFSIVYFLMYLCYKTKIRKEYKIDDLKLFRNKFITFVISSLFVGLLSCFFLIPYLNLISSTGAIDFQLFLPKNDTYAYKIDFINLLVGCFNGIQHTDLRINSIISPNITCGVFTVFLFLSFIFNKKININCKLTYIVILFFLILAFLWAPMDHIFNLFHVPNDLPYRYSFIYSFIFIVISSYAVFNYDKNSKFNCIALSILIIFLIILRFVSLDIISNNVIYLNIFILVIYFVVFNFTRNDLFRNIFILLIVIIECLFVINNYFKVDSVSKDSYYVNQCNNVDDFRCGIYSKSINNSSYVYDYKSVSSFSSVEYGYIARLMYNLGLESNSINSFKYNKNSNIFDILFAVDGDNLLFSVDKRIKDLYLNKNDRGVINQNNIAINAFNSDLFYESKDDYKINVIYEDDDFIIEEYNFDKSKVVQISNANFIIDDNILRSLNIYFKKFDLLDYDFTTNYNGFYITEINDGGNLVIGRFKVQDFKINIYNEDKSTLDDIKRQIEDNNLNVIVNKEHYLKMDIDIKEDSVILSSIPYDDGWNVYVDGKEVSTYKLLDSLLGFDISSGTHTIELEYEIPKLKGSFIISAISFIIYVIYLIIGKRKAK